MTMKPDKSEQCFTEAATKPREEYLAGLTEAEHATLERLLKGLCYTGKTTTLETLHIQSILQKMSKSLKTSEENLSDSSNRSQYKELKQELQSLRKRINELEDELEAGGALL